VALSEKSPYLGSAWVRWVFTPSLTHEKPVQDHSEIIVGEKNLLLAGFHSRPGFPEPEKARKSPVAKFARQKGFASDR
jgi:hypothetical protein